jgi:hypothetical protein
MKYITQEPDCIASTSLLLYQQDKTWAKLSTLDLEVLVYVTQLHSQQQQPNLKLKTWPKQLLGYLQLAFGLPE